MSGGWKSYEDEIIIRFKRALHVEEVDNILEEARRNYRGKPKKQWALDLIEEEARITRRSHVNIHDLISNLDLPDV